MAPIDRENPQDPQTRSGPRVRDPRSLVRRTDLIEACVRTVSGALGQGVLLVIAVLFIILWDLRAALPVAIYPLGVWGSAVYLNHHYIIDIALAVLYVVGANILTDRMLFPLLFGRNTKDGDRDEPKEQAAATGV